MLKKLRIMGLALSAAALVVAGQPPAGAIKIYRDMETGGLYTAPGENREEFKPFGLDIGFTFFLEYRTELEKRDLPVGVSYPAKNTATAPYDAFAANRTVMDMRRNFGQGRRARLVLDTRGASNDYRVYIRHVIGEIDFPSFSSTLSFGEISTPTIAFDDSFWGYRVQGTSFTEREGLFTSGDWGIGWHWKPTRLPIDWYTTFTNGEGRTTPEANSGKAVESRLTWKTPIDGLQASGFGFFSRGGNVVGNPNNGVGIEQTRFGGGLYYRKPFYRVAVSGVVATDEANNYANSILLLSNNVANMNRQSVPPTGTVNRMKSKGWSTMGVVDIPGSEWSVLGRYDHFRPGDVIGDNGHHRYIIGPAYKVNDNITVLLTYEKLAFERAARTASGNLTANAFNQQRLLLQSLINF